MFAQLKIKNKVLKNTLLVFLTIVLIPLIVVLIQVIKTYGTIVGSLARYAIETKMLP